MDNVVACQHRAASASCGVGPPAEIASIWPEGYQVRPDNLQVPHDLATSQRAKSTFWPEGYQVRLGNLRATHHPATGQPRR